MLGDVRWLETRVWRQRLRVDTGDRHPGKEEHKSRPLRNSPVLHAGRQDRRAQRKAAPAPGSGEHGNLCGD